MKTPNYSILTLFAALFLCLSCQSNGAVDNANSNRKLILQYHEIWSNGQTERLNEIMAPDFICHYLTDVEWKGIEGAKTEINNWRKLFPDWHEEVVDVIIEKDKVVTRYNSTGTHSGTYEGIDSTGAKIMIAETSIYRIKEGKIAEQWCFPDDLGLKNQLLKAVNPN
jgi:predicted ester cyclase